MPWGTVAYGSPRNTHFHAAGKDPGDISIQLFDASIQFDDETLCDNGGSAISTAMKSAPCFHLTSASC